MKESTKRFWDSPKLIIYGNLKEITLGCKTESSPTDGHFLGSEDKPLTSCV